MTDQSETWRDVIHGGFSHYYTLLSIRFPRASGDVIRLAMCEYKMDITSVVDSLALLTGGHGIVDPMLSNRIWELACKHFPCSRTFIFRAAIDAHFEGALESVTNTLRRAELAFNSDLACLPSENAYW